MGGSNIETVKRACAAWGTGDISIYPAMYAPDVTAHAGMLAPEVPDGEVTGVADIMRIFESLLATFDHSELKPEGFYEDGDRLVVPLLMRAVTRESPVPIEWRVVAAYRFRDGLIAHQAWYETREEALDAVEVPRSATMIAG
jgi:ketosteroid isomerase-like protein